MKKIDKLNIRFSFDLLALTCLSHIRYSKSTFLFAHTLLIYNKLGIMTATAGKSEPTRNGNAPTGSDPLRKTSLSED